MINWIISVSSFSLLITILSFLVPSGKIKPFVVSIYLILGVFIVVSPIGNIENYLNIENEFVYSNENIEPQEKFLRYILKQKEQNCEDFCSKLINEKGIENYSVNVYFYSTENYNLMIDKIEINLYDSVIISDKEHINIIEEIEKDLIKYLNLNSKQIIISYI